MLELLRELSIKSFENAEELYIEANILFNNGKYSRAFFLAQIAGEELGKHVICIGGLGNYIEGEFNFSRFQKRFLNHKEKTQSIDVFESFNFNNMERILSKKVEIDSQELEKMKLMGLYCDFIDYHALSS